jgi:hypothetical protein
MLILFIMKKKVSKIKDSELIGLDINKITPEQLEEILKLESEKLEAAAYSQNELKNTPKDLPPWIHFT